MGSVEGTTAVDRDLVVAFQAGDESAYDEIFRRHRARVQGICTRLLGPGADAEEAVQETFLRAYQALGRFNGRYQLGAWLARIATNISVDQLRSRARRNLVSLPLEIEEPPSVTGPEEQIAGGEPRLVEALATIQPLHASALKLRAVHGYSHEEIAGQLSMSPGQVKALLHRARSSLRKAWERAEGWALLPLVGLRRALDQRFGAQAPAQFAHVAPSAGPVLVERVAASALVVATAAVTVLGSGTSPVPTGPVPGTIARPDAAQAPRAETAPEPAVSGPAEEAEPEGGLLDGLPLELPDIEQQPQAQQHEDADAPEGEPEPNPLPGPGQTASIRRTAEGVLERALLQD